MGDDGFPLVRYGFVGGVDNGGPIVVMFDGELGGEVVDPSEIEPVHMSNVTLVPACTASAPASATRPRGTRWPSCRVAATRTYSEPSCAPTIATP